MVTPQSAYQADQAAWKAIKDTKTPSPNSATFVRVEPGSPTPLKAAIDVGDLRLGKRAEPQGASDPSNNCYRNATLLTLLCTDGFMGFIRNHWLARRAQAIRDASSDQEVKPGEKDEHPFQLLSELWEVYWSETASLKDVDRKMRKIWPALQRQPLIGQDIQPTWKQISPRGREQQDVHEFLNWLIAAERESLGILEKAFSDYIDLFSVTTTNFILCRTCMAEHPQRSRRVYPEENNMLMIGLPNYNGGTYTLSEAVERDFKYELEGYACDHCKAPSDIEKQSGVGWRYFARLPQIMFMHLNRTQQERGKGAEKNRTKVLLPESTSFEKWLDPDHFKQPAQHVNADYELTGIVSHSGDLDAGHYLTYVLVDAKWYEINGNRCQETDFATASAAQDDDWTPTILVWQRRSDSAVKTGQGAKSSETVADSKASSPVDKKSSPKQSAGSKTPSPASKKSSPKQAATGGARSPSKSPSKLASPSPSGPTAAPKIPTYLRVRVGIDHQAILLHHRIEPQSGLVDRANKNKGPGVSLDVHLVQEEPGSRTAFEVDLFAAAKRAINNQQLIGGDVSIQALTDHEPCQCEAVHEGACRAVVTKRKVSEIEEPPAVRAGNPSRRVKGLPELFSRPGDDPDAYPSMRQRWKIQMAVQRAIKTQEKWRNGQPTIRGSAGQILRSPSFTEQPFYTQFLFAPSSSASPNEVALSADKWPTSRSDVAPEFTNPNGGRWPSSAEKPLVTQSRYGSSPNDATETADERQIGHLSDSPEPFPILSPSLNTSNVAQQQQENDPTPPPSPLPVDTQPAQPKLPTIDTQPLRPSNLRFSSSSSTPKPTTTAVETPKITASQDEQPRPRVVSRELLKHTVRTRALLSGYTPPRIVKRRPQRRNWLHKHRLNLIRFGLPTSVLMLLVAAVPSLRRGAGAAMEAVTELALQFAKLAGREKLEVLDRHVRLIGTYLGDRGSMLLKTLKLAISKAALWGDENVIETLKTIVEAIRTGLGHRHPLPRGEAPEPQEGILARMAHPILVGLGHPRVPELQEQRDRNMRQGGEWTGQGVVVGVGGSAL